jgi:hypothetical protein
VANETICVDVFFCFCRSYVFVARGYIQYMCAHSSLDRLTCVQSPEILSSALSLGTNAALACLVKTSNKVDLMVIFR